MYFWIFFYRNVSWIWIKNWNISHNVYNKSASSSYLDEVVDWLLRESPEDVHDEWKSIDPDSFEERRKATFESVITRQSIVPTFDATNENDKCKQFTLTVLRKIQGQHEVKLLSALSLSYFMISGYWTTTACPLFLMWNEKSWCLWFDRKMLPTFLLF